MKKFLSRYNYFIFTIILLISILFFKIITYANNEIVINNTNFPDVYFQGYLKSTLDLDKNGKLSTMEQDITEINISNLNIQDLKGIEFFTKLETLNCNQNQIRQMDLSNNKALKNLFCQYNYLTTLNLEYNTNLKQLICSDNTINKLNLNNNPNIETLNCNNNKLLNLNLSNNKNILNLYCKNNSITNLNLSNNTSLQTIQCDNNQLVCLDTSKSNIFYFTCNNNETYVLNKQDISKFDNFDLNKVSNLSGGIIKDNKITFNEDSEKITYNYDCGNNKKVLFTLNLHVHKGNFVPGRLPTTKLEGKKEYYHCDICNKNFKDKLCTIEIIDEIEEWCRIPKIVESDKSQTPSDNTTNKKEDDKNNNSNNNNQVTSSSNNNKNTNQENITNISIDNKHYIFKNKGNTYKILSHKNKTVTFYKVKKNTKNLIIPKTIKYKGINYKVTNISSNSFKNNKKIKKVTLDKNIKIIEKNAFYGCKNLKYIIIKSKILSKVNKNAFKGIHKKAKIKVPRSKYKKYKKIIKNKGQSKTVKISK